MKITQPQNNGVHIHPQATMDQLLADDLMQQFGEGVLVAPLQQLPPQQTLHKVLYHNSSWAAYPLFAALLMLDAELNARLLTDTDEPDTGRVFPLRSFLDYRHRLPPEELTLTTVRLPPLNYNGHYLLTMEETVCAAVRMDIHPEERVAGHVRLVVSHPQRLPTRLRPSEARLTWQPLAMPLFEEALSLSSTTHTPLTPPLQTAEHAALKGLFAQLI